MQNRRFGCMEEAQTLGNVSNNLNDDVAPSIHGLIAKKVVPKGTDCMCGKLSTFF